MADGGKAIVLAGLGLVLLLKSRKVDAMSSRTKTEMRLSPHFMLSEFLRSRSVPEVAYYQPSEDELRNVKLLVDRVLEPLRLKYGPVRITGSMRPASVRNAKGQTFNEALREAGYRPADRSDHELFAGTDFQLPRATVETYSSAYSDLAANPSVRQVILYLETDPATRRRYVDHVHVSVVAPGLPRLPPSLLAFATLDGQRVDQATA